MSVAKEGKVFEQKKALQPLLDTSEGTKITWISLFLTSATPTVYSTVDPLSGQESPHMTVLVRVSIWSQSADVKIKTSSKSWRMR